MAGLVETQERTPAWARRVQGSQLGLYCRNQSVCVWRGRDGRGADYEDILLLDEAGEEKIGRNQMEAEKTVWFRYLEEFAED